jgi:hypothetical protein
MNSIQERYSDKIDGVISSYDRIVIQGTLPTFCYAEGMTSYLYANQIRIFDYPRFAEPLRDEIRENAEKIAKENDIEIEHIRKKGVRKESIIEKIIEKRGTHPGLVHIISVMERCPSYKPWHDKNTHKTFLIPVEGKCLHYYFYFIDEELGLMYVRVPTWCPFRLQIYFNGHNLLNTKLRRKNIEFNVLDNALINISDYEKAQNLSDNLSVKFLHKTMDSLALKYCPVIKKFHILYHWSIMQVEYSTDIVFKKQRYLKEIYERVVRTAIHTVKPEHIASFLGRKLHPLYKDEMGNDFNTRIEGTRIKHTMGPVSIKMYDKQSLVLRIETTVNNPSFFKHYREVEQRDGQSLKKNAPMKKHIYSLNALQELLLAANQRYLAFISNIEDCNAGTRKLQKVSDNVMDNNRTYKGFNLFSKEDETIFESIASGAFLISGFKSKHLKNKLVNKSSSQISRILKRLRVHGLIKKVGRTYKYYMSQLGMEIITLGLKLKQLYIIPQLSMISA